MAFKFERLKVWEMAVDLSGDVSELVKTFPKDELYVLTSQIKRACDSISLSIAEGSTGQTTPEFKKFLVMPFGHQLRLLGAFTWLRNENSLTKKASTLTMKN